MDAVEIAERRAEREALEAKLAEMEAKREAIAKARMQPKLPEEEKAIADRYGEMDLKERAFNILADLGLIELHDDPDSVSYDNSSDEELVPENVVV